MNNTPQFLIFISIVITVYSLLNYYFIRKHNNILTGRSLPVLLLRLTIITMILTPIATVYFSYRDIPLGAAITGFTGYSWLAFLFLFLVVHGTADIALFVMEKTGYTAPKHAARRVFAITMAISLSVLLYGYHEAGDIRTERLAIETGKLPAGTDSVRIALISDVHFGPLISVRAAENIRKLVQDENPDIIISAGDLLDRAIRDSTEVARIIAGMKAHLGKYAITGNHEFYAGIDYSMKFTTDAGFTMIRNTTVTAGGIVLAGVDDREGPRYGIRPARTEEEILSGIDPSKYTILLKHQPRIRHGSPLKFDLQLSGHTHAGQIFPFTFLVRLAFPYICGLYELGGSSKLYVSRGTGTWGPPVRFLAPPEITIIDITSSRNKTSSRSSRASLEKSYRGHASRRITVVRDIFPLKNTRLHIITRQKQSQGKITGQNEKAS